MSDPHPEADEKPGDEVPPGTPSATPNLCDVCGGSGKVDGKRCDNCRGTGLVEQAVGGG
jgi:DnaJ-class molecular chaperone